MRFAALVPFVATGAFLSISASAQTLDVTTRASVSSTGAQTDLTSYEPAVSRDGRYVAFASQATNLVSGDTNGQIDVFVRDRLLGVTTRASVGPGGVQANGKSSAPSISGDGRQVAFESLATNLVTGDTNGVSDVFVLDCTTGMVTRVSVHSNGFQGDGASTDAAISVDGRYVAFASMATNLVNGDTNGVSDVFVHDLQRRQTERVSVSSTGAEAKLGCWNPSVAEHGLFVAFDSWSANLVAGDTNGWGDVFVRDRAAGTTERISLGAGGVEGDDESWNPSISADGGSVAFESWATNLVGGFGNYVGNVYVRDRAAGATERVSVDTYGVEADDDSWSPSISANGRHVAFLSSATNLVAGDSNGQDDAFVHDRSSGVTERVSLHSSGAEANRDTDEIAITVDGRFVAFRSFATNLVAGDTNGRWDVFAHDRLSGGPELAMQNLVAGQWATLAVSGASPSGSLLIGLSLSGQGAFGSPWGIIDLAPPIALLTVVADGGGNVALPVPVPAVLAGWPVWLHGIDAAASYPTASFGALVR